MPRRGYGPAEYDPDEVPTWRGIEGSINGYIAYNGYWPYGGLMDGYRLPPELMQRQYVSDQLVQEAAAAMNRQLEEVVDTVNMGVDATVETVNEGLQGAMEATNELASEGVDEIVGDANGLLETVMDTKHEGRGVRNSDDEPERGDEVYSTSHDAIQPEDEPVGPVAAVNRGIDAALEEDENQPSMLEAMGDASWRVAGGLAAWAEGVQHRNYEASHGGAEPGASREAKQAPSREPGVYSTYHGMQAAMDAGLDLGRQEEVYSSRHAAYGPATDGSQMDRTPMALAFGTSSARDFSLDRVAQPVAQRTPEETMAIQMDRYQQSLELLSTIDFGALFQKDFSLDI